MKQIIENSILEMPVNIAKESSLDISVVVPVYKSENTLPSLLKKITEEVEKLNLTYEIILVEDCGGDNSWEVMCDLRKTYDCITPVQLMRNFGQHNALMCGFSFCNGKYIITLDDDLQNPPEEIPKLIAAIEEGHDVVYGTPPKRKQNFFRNLGSSFVRFIYKKIFNIKVDLTSFRIMRREVVKGITKYTRNYTFVDGLIAWHTSRISQVEVRHEPRKAGETGYSLKSLITLTLNMLTNFSIGPLQLATIFGLLFSAIGFLIAVWFILKFFVYDIPVPGFTSIIVSITLFSGVQMLTLGLIGEYLGRMHLNINSKPQYYIRNYIAPNKNNQ